MRKTKRTLPWLYIGLLLLVIGGVLWPLFHPGFFVSDDGEWMIIRLSAFYQSLSSGQFPTRFLGRLNNNYGYPVSNFLYPGYLYLGSVLHGLGMSFPLAVKLILGLSVSISSLIIFFALIIPFGVVPAFFGSVSFLLTPYLYFDLYTRGSVGEVLSLLPASLLLFALEAGVYWIIPPAVAFLILSHNTAAVLILAVFSVLLIVRRTFVKTVPHLLMGVGMATFFWAPAVFEQIYVRFSNVIISDPRQYFIGLDRIELIGIPTVLAMAVVLSTKGKWKSLVALITISYFFVLPVSYPVWTAVPYLSKIVQFPYRFLLLTVLIGPWVVASAVRSLAGVKRILFLSVAVCLWIIPISVMARSIRYEVREIGYYTTNEGTTTVADEYMPRWVSAVARNRPVDTIEVIRGDATVQQKIFIHESIDTTVEAKEQSVIRINKIYYPGWGVTIDNELVPISYRNREGVMEVSVDPGTHRLTAAFRETPGRFAADLISVACVVLYAVVFRRLLKRS